MSGRVADKLPWQKGGCVGGALRLLVITYWDQGDPLVVNYTLPYLRQILGILPPGSRIHLVTLDKEQRKGSTIEGEAGILHHSFPYRPFGMRGMAALPSLVMALCGIVEKHRIDVVHAWCTPAGMLGYLVSVLSRRPLVVDSYEPHAEAMVENGTWRKGGVAFRILFLFERLQTRRAAAVVAAASGMREYAKQRYGMVPQHFYVKPACVDLARFAPQRNGEGDAARPPGLQGKLVAVYAGKFGGIYLGQEVFDLFRAARDHWGEKFNVLLLTSHTAEELAPYMLGAGLPPGMFTMQWARPQDVPEFLAMADWAITPVKPVPTKRFCTPIKDGEYWAAGLPVMITPGISDDSDLIATHAIGSVIHTLDRAGYEQAVYDMDQVLKNEDRTQLQARIRAIAERYRSFRIAEQVYRDLYGAAG